MALGFENLGGELIYSPALRDATTGLFTPKPRSLYKLSLSCSFMFEGDDTEVQILYLPEDRLVELDVTTWVENRHHKKPGRPPGHIARLCELDIDTAQIYGYTHKMRAVSGHTKALDEPISEMEQQLQTFDADKESFFLRLLGSLGLQDDEPPTESPDPL